MRNNKAAYVFFSVATDKLCASFAPNGANNKLLTEIDRKAGQYR
jgi:hypothetical protein